MKVDSIMSGAAKVIGYFALFSIFALAAHNPSFADDTATLTVQPKKCAVLRKGKKCYKKIRISFTAPIKGDYCLHIVQDKVPLKCWQNSVEGKLTYDFKSDKSVQFYLHQAADVVVAESEFNVAWVYSNRRRSRNHWRLF